MATHRRHSGALAARLLRINLPRQLTSKCVLGLQGWGSTGVEECRGPADPLVIPPY